MKYHLIDSTTKTPISRLPTQIKGFTILRFVEQRDELVVRQDSSMELMRTRPAVLGLKLVPVQ